MNEHPIVSIVLPVYNEEENVQEVYRRITQVMEGEQAEYEIVFVDDGCSDRTPEILRNIARTSPRVRLVELARNFGHQIAISAGLDHALGAAVVVMDADLQDPPEVLPQLITKWREGFEVVYAVRERRPENWFKRLAYASFYRILARIAEIEIPLDSGDFCIMDRRIVDLLKAMPERNRFIRGIRSWVGLRQTGLAYARDPRRAGTPKYSLWKLIVLALDGFVSFSRAPLRVASLSGFAISLISVAMAVFYVVKRLTTGLNPAGFATLAVAIFFLSGIQLITIGVMGEYIGRIYDEVKQRPLYVIKSITGKEKRCDS